MGEIRERCAVVGTFGPNATELTALALRELDHRGPDSTGIGGITPAGGYESFAEPGRAREVLKPHVVSQVGELGLVATVGHCRYATSGDGFVGYPINTGNSLYAENGNGSDLSLLERDLDRRGINTRGMNDSQMSAWAIGDRVKSGASVVEAIADTYPLMVGAHASVINGKGLSGEPLLAAFRDPCGIRPLVLGATKEGGYMIASETTGLDAAGATYIKDVPPGGLITISENGIEEYELASPNPKYDPFEIIYFSNKNSRFVGHRIGDIRAALGARFAQEHSEMFADTTAVVYVPNSGKPYAEGLAAAWDKPHLLDTKGHGAIQKITDERTFLQATLAMRRALRNKSYSYTNELLAGHDLTVIDDSLVRNNTAPTIHGGLMSAGARSVSVAIGSPPIIYPNFYGINMPSQRELTAATKSIEEIRRDIGCKRLGYLSLEGMLDVLTEVTGVPADHFDLSCFTGDYPIPIGRRDIRRPVFSGYAA